MGFIKQYVDKRLVNSRIEQLGTTQAAVARLAGISPPLFSMALAGTRAFSLEAQQRIFEVLDFLRDLSGESGALPLDLRDPERLVPAFEKWKAEQHEAAVVRTLEEQAKATPAE